MSAGRRVLTAVSLAMISAALPSVRAGFLGFRFAVNGRRIILFELVGGGVGREVASILAVDGTEFDCCRLLLEDAVRGRR